MTAFHAIHDTLRAELVHIARITSKTDDDPWLALSAGTGWRLFKQSLHLHLTTEEDALWPVLRRTLAARSAELVLLEAIDTVLADPDRDLGRLGDLTDSLAIGLCGHLTREEDQVLPLVRRFVTRRQWANFGRLHAERLAARS
jgi:iron-sulfur cluster repair protein YtfE (RIC family)